VHPDANRSRAGSDDRPDLVESETRSVTQREQMLLFGIEATNHCLQLRHPFTGQDLLLDAGSEQTAARATGSSFCLRSVSPRVQLASFLTGSPRATLKSCAFAA
jgi:hypothetical protein